MDNIYSIAIHTCEEIYGGQSAKLVQFWY